MMTTRDPLYGERLEWLDGDMPFSTLFDDHFFARNDGRAECGHVFLGGNGLPERWFAGGDFTIGELGFGTALNFLETWRQWEDCRPDGGAMLHFVSFEAYPMPAAALQRAIAAWPDLEPRAAALVDCGWGQAVGPVFEWQADDRTRLTVMVGDAADRLAAWQGCADAWFLDGFAPSRNPQMWSLPLMEQLAAKTVEQGTFASYTAAGWVRRNLQAAGFDVKKLPGYGGKREMIAGVKRRAPA